MSICANRWRKKAEEKTEKQVILNGNLAGNDQHSFGCLEHIVESSSLNALLHQLMFGCPLAWLSGLLAAYFVIIKKLLNDFSLRRSPISKREKDLTFETCLLLYTGCQNICRFESKMISFHSLPNKVKSIQSWMPKTIR